MSDYKMECVGCGSYGSDVGNAFYEGRPCKFCGLSASAAAEIMAVRAQQADQKLKTRLETAIKERDTAQVKLAEAEKRLDRLADDLENLHRLASEPLDGGESHG